MKPNFSLHALLWFVFFGAVLSAFYADYRWKSNLTSVVVASRHLDLHTKITTDDIDLRVCHVSRVPEGAITQASDVLGKTISERKTKDSPIFLNEILDEKQRLFVDDFSWRVASITIKSPVEPLEKLKLRAGELISVYVAEKCLLKSVRVWDLGDEPNTVMVLVNDQQGSLLTKTDAKSFSVQLIGGSVVRE